MPSDENKALLNMETNYTPEEIRDAIKGLEGLQALILPAMATANMPGAIDAAEQFDLCLCIARYACSELIAALTEGGKP
jgi:hypothetical protein